LTDPALVNRNCSVPDPDGVFTPVFAVTVYVAPLPETAVTAVLPLTPESLVEKFPVPTPTTDSVKVTDQLTEEAIVGDGSRRTIDNTFGAVWSITQVYEAAELVFAPTSARTWNVCDIADRPEYDFEPVLPEPHAANAEPSSEHWKLTDEAYEYENDAEDEFVGFAGIAVIVGADGGAANARYTPNPPASTTSTTTPTTARLAAPVRRRQLIYDAAFRYTSNVAP
jgi:hypothetical protein